MGAEPPDTSRGARLWDELRSFVSRDPDLARYMQLSFEEFHRRGEWPNIEQLQKRLLRAGDHIDLYAEYPENWARIRYESSPSVIWPSPASRYATAPRKSAVTSSGY